MELLILDNYWIVDLTKQKPSRRIYMARIIDSENTNIVGKNIRLHRKKRRMTQQALSNRLELLGVYVCRGSVSRIEYGVRTVTDIELLAIARVLEVSVNDLFTGNEHFFDWKNIIEKPFPFLAENVRGGALFIRIFLNEKQQYYGCILRPFFVD